MPLKSPTDGIKWHQYYFQTISVLFSNNFSIIFKQLKRMVDFEQVEPGLQVGGQFYGCYPGRENGVLKS